MKRPQKKIQHDPTLTGSLQDGDGLDPRYESREHAKSEGAIDRKAAKLCAQVRRALEYLVPESLQNCDLDATVLDVQPAPNTGHLLVLIQSTDAATEMDRQALELAIAHRSGLLRTAVAQSIQRRKAPTLTFRVI